MAIPATRPRIGCMSSKRPSLAFLLPFAFCGATFAQDAPLPAAPPAKDMEPKVELTVIEDGGARIEELKVRGQTQRITVSPKGARSYEILPADQGRDMSESAGSQRGAAGKRVWRVFNF